MSKKLYEESNIQAIANAIRNKVGGSDTYLPSEMAAAINSYEPSGGVTIIPKSQWESMSSEQKRSSGIIIIQDSDQGFHLGEYVNASNYSEPPEVITFDGLSTKYARANMDYLNPQLQSNGRYTILVVFVAGNSAGSIENVSILLNDIDITSSFEEVFEATSYGGIKGYAYRNNFAISDNIRLVNKTVREHGGVNLIIFNNVAIDSINLIGNRGNDGTSFTIPANSSSDEYYYEVANIGYYNGYNSSGKQTRLFHTDTSVSSTPTPSGTWYGVTYVISVGS